MNLLDLHDDVLHVLCEIVSTIHPPHWEFPDLGEHGQQPEQVYPDQSTLSSRHFCLGWVHLSHVCRRLRDICLDSPALWAKVVLAFPCSEVHARELPLARARDLPLTLQTHSEYRSAGDSTHAARYRHKVEFATTLIHRAARFEIVFDGHSTFDWRPILRKQTYTELAHLDIWQTPFAQSTIDAPNLISLSMIDLIPILPSPLPFLRILNLCLNLRTATLDGTRGEDAVCEVLRGTPLIEKLSVELMWFGFGEPSPTSVAWIKNPVELKHLETAKIQIHGGDTVGIIWPAILAPERASIDLSISDHFSENATLFQSVARQMRCPDYTHIFLSLNYWFNLSVNPVFTAEANGAARLTLHAPSAGYVDAIGRVEVAANPQRIQSAYLALATPCNVEAAAPALLAFLGAFRAVIKLVLETDTQTTMPTLDLLASDPASLLPSLETLGLKPTSEVNTWEMYTPQQFWDAVVGLLEARAGAGRRVSSLLLLGAWTWPWRDEVGREAWDAFDLRARDRAAAFVDEVHDMRDAEEIRVLVVASAASNHRLST